AVLKNIHRDINARRRPNLPELFTLKLKIHGSIDTKKLFDTGPAGIMDKFSRRDALCWTRILGAQVDENIVKFFCRDSDSLKRIEERKGEISSILGVEKLDFVAELYYVEAIDFKFPREQFSGLRDRDGIWGKTNQVKIVFSQQTFGR
ncbi:hypothetical protein LZ30DRAFT_574641, partial [Colletotrichum cereale]